MSACCAAATPPHLTPWDCFQRGLGTLRLPPLPLQGESMASADGRQASFSLRLTEGRLTELRFSCTHCTTLIACCQALVELNRGCALRTPRALDAAQLLACLPGLPPAKRECAVLASAALRSALVAAGATLSSQRESA